ncbi:hypothetical protein LARI1_G008157 [Lachnellula arida]|uniref:ASCH domain-containing protein n=1 Tax=Lachnellula arida TaxID=1316785 RepID=A0A8T9B4P0_9HELO|nr:hypothetical protein LARI1_G008157 [Lachnellula arida]
MEHPETIASLITDVILAIQEPYMQQMIDGEKTYEFRKYRLPQTVERVWFYSTAPHSQIQYVCQIEPAVTRNEDDTKLPEDGLGSKEFNGFHRDWDRYDFAYKILSVYKLNEPVTLAALKQDHGLGGAPQRVVYAPLSLTESVPWHKQAKLR